MDTIYRTTYHGTPYAEGGEPGPDTTDPRQFAKDTLLSHQWMAVTAPDGTLKVFKYIGANKDRLISIAKTTWKEAFGFDK